MLSITTRANDDGGWRFLGVAFAAATLSIIFFFSLLFFFPTMREGVHHVVDALTHRVIQGGGITVKKIHLVTTGDSEASLRLVQVLRGSIEEEIQLYEGQSFWFVDIGKMQTNLLRRPWVRDASVRRVFPGTLEVHVKSREPRFLVRSRSRWVVVDPTGIILSMSREVPGVFLNLPVVYGREERFSRGRNIEEIQRSLGQQRTEFEDLSRIVHQIESVLAVEVERIEVGDDSWTRGVTAKMTLYDKASGNRFAVTLPIYKKDIRWTSLQYILSDLAQKSIQPVAIDGRFAGRWIVNERGINHGER